jgi:hypothetical protein
VHSRINELTEVQQFPDVAVRVEAAAVDPRSAVQWLDMTGKFGGTRRESLVEPVSAERTGDKLEPLVP